VTEVDSVCCNGGEYGIWAGLGELVSAAG